MPGLAFMQVCKYLFVFSCYFFFGVLGTTIAVLICHSVCATGFPGSTSGKEFACQCRRQKRDEFDPQVGKIPQMKAWQPLQYSGEYQNSPVPEESRGQRSLVGYNPKVAKSQTQLKRLNTHTHTHMHVTRCFPNKIPLLPLIIIAKFIKCL